MTDLSYLIRTDDPTGFVVVGNPDAGVAGTLRLGWTEMHPVAELIRRGPVETAPGEETWFLDFVLEKRRTDVLLWVDDEYATFDAQTRGEPTPGGELVLSPQAAAPALALLLSFIVNANPWIGEDDERAAARVAAATAIIAAQRAAGADPVCFPARGICYDCDRSVLEAVTDPAHPPTQCPHCECSWSEGASVPADPGPITWSDEDDLVV